VQGVHAVHDVHGVDRVHGVHGVDGVHDVHGVFHGVCIAWSQENSRCSCL
jgi:hypothetical protein